MRTRRLHLSTLLLAAVLLAFPAAAEGFKPPPVVIFDGRADKALEDAIAARLNGRVEAGHLVVEAKAPPGQGAISSTSLAGPGGRTVFVDVRADFPSNDDARSGPGLVIRHSDAADGPTTFSLVRTANGYLINGWRKGTVAQTIGGSLPSPKPADRWVRLGARETADGVEFTVDGRRVATLAAGDAPGRDVGLVALGSGTFFYDNYGFNATGRLDAPPPPPDAAKAPIAPKPEVASAGSMPPAGETPTPPPGGAPAPLPPIWIGENNQPVGPLDGAALRQRIAAGTLTRDTLVWTTGMPGWQPAASVPPIAALLPPPTPPPLTVASPPPPPASATDPSQFMLGNWTLEAEDTLDGVGPVTIRLDASYEANGMAQATGTLQPQAGGPPMPVSLGGNWRAIAQGPGRFRFDFQGMMRIDPGGGRPPQVRPITDGSEVTIVDANTIRSDNGVVQRRARP